MHTYPPEMIEPDSEKTPRKKSTSFVVGALAAVSALYLLNPGFGVFEIIPDNIPVVGNLDEAGATALLISCFAYFGLDVTKLIHFLLRLLRGEVKPTRMKPKPPPGTIDVETR